MNEHWKHEVYNNYCIALVKGKERIKWEGTNHLWIEFESKEDIDVKLGQLKKLGIGPAEDRVSLLNAIRLELQPKQLAEYNPEDFFDRGKFVSKLLADKIMKKIEIKTLHGNHEIYYYENGLYLKKGKDKIRQLCLNMLQDKYTKNRFAETVSYIEGSTFIDPTEIDNEWVNLENGLLNPLTREFIEHTPEVFSTIRVPIKYDKKADCPLFKKALQEKLDKPTRTVLQEMFGYIYLPKQPFEKAFLFYGQRRTMKSTTLHILGKLIGKENITGHTLQYLSHDRFAKGYLYGVPANICADLPTSALKETGTFLMITGGDLIAGEKKGQDPIHFYPSTKLIFSCNDIPPTTNKNLAYYRRWILLEFSKQTRIDDIDEKFKEKLEEELPGILNWALEGLTRLLKEHGFSYWLSEEEVKDLYERSSDSIQSFIFNFIDTENDEGIIKKREAYNKYKKYCLEENLRLEHQIKFGKMFFALTNCGRCEQKKIPAYKGVSWKEKPKQGKLKGVYNTRGTIDIANSLDNCLEKLSNNKKNSIVPIVDKKEPKNEGVNE